MPVASSASTTARRGVLGGAASLLALATAASAGAQPAVAPHADAALLELCASLERTVTECTALGDRCDALLDAGASLDAQKRAWADMDAASDRENRLLEQITPIKPQTLAGLVAKARAYRRMTPHFGGDEPTDIFAEAGLALVDDILRLGGAA